MVLATLTGSTHGNNPGRMTDAPSLTYGALPVHGDLLRYAEAGAPADGDPARPVVVLVHGIASRATQWDRVMAGLARTCHVIAPDLLGHGESAKPRGDYSLGAHACGIRDLLSALGHDRVSLVGHSLGGGIAMQFTYQFPERVERLALVGAGGLGPEVSLFLRAATLPGSEVVLPVIAHRWVRTLGGTVGSWLGALGVPVSPGVAAALQGYASLGDARTREAFIHTARAVVDVRGQRVDARDRLHRATGLPMLVVWGARDAIIPLSHGTALAAAVPSARLEVFAQSGHFPHLTEPDRLAGVLADWVATTDAAHLDAATLTGRTHPGSWRPA